MKLPPPSTTIGPQAWSYCRALQKVRAEGRAAADQVMSLAFSRPASRHGSLSCLFQVASYLPS